MKPGLEFEKGSSQQNAGAGNASQTSNQNVNAEETVAKLELNGLSVEKIIALWHDKLQVHLDVFADTAQRVRERDVVLIENQTKITELAKKAQLLKGVCSLNAWDSVGDHVYFRSKMSYNGIWTR